VPVRGQEVGRLAGALLADEGGSPAARVVAAAGRLHLDDAGAEVAQHHRGVRARQGPGEIDDDDAVQGSGHRAHQPGRTRMAHTSSGPASVTMIAYPRICL